MHCMIIKTIKVVRKNSTVQAHVIKLILNEQLLHIVTLHFTWKNVQAALRRCWAKTGGPGMDEMLLYMMHNACNVWCLARLCILLSMMRLTWLTCESVLTQHVKWGVAWEFSLMSSGLNTLIMTWICNVTLMMCFDAYTYPLEFTMNNIFGH